MSKLSDQQKPAYANGVGAPTPAVTTVTSKASVTAPEHRPLTSLELVSPTEQRVSALIAEFAQSWKHTLELAIELGEALVELKAELGHGK
jgi:hypothetical protein